MDDSFVDISRIATGLACLVLLMFGVRWQARTFRGDETGNQRRMWSALAIAVTAVIGAAVWITYSLIDPKSKVTVFEGGRYLVGMSLLATAFLVKTWVGPLLVCATVSWAAYFFVAYGEIQLLPIFELIVQAAFEDAPDGVTNIFATLTIAHAIVGSLFASAIVSDLH